VTGLPGVKFAEWPQRKCRQPVTEDGLIDHWCDLADLHPGPHCPSTHRASIERRARWEADHPGWEKLRSGDDPFADLAKKLEGRQ
jgi:hypothetical protein